jgi:hypothetical protein
MRRLGTLVAIGLGALAAACGDSSPAAPTPSFVVIQPSPPPPVTGNYAGVWNGTTSIGTVMTFRVSAGNIVTAISFGYRDAACSGTYDDADLALAIDRPGALANPQFFYVGPLRIAPTVASVLGRFSSETVASGTALLDRLPTCAGTVGITWNAIKQ